MHNKLPVIDLVVAEQTCSFYFSTMKNTEYKFMPSIVLKIIYIDEFLFSQYKL